jgi:glycosyltransferase involved in cell wall biosynthesis
MPRYLNAMDVLAVPSYTSRRWREQFGRVIVEAMACGVAVLGSDSGEIPHVIADAGIVLPERDVDAWTRAIDALVVDTVQRAELTARGLSRARTFSADAAAAAHARFFDELTGTA